MMASRLEPLLLLVGLRDSKIIISPYYY